MLVDIYRDEAQEKILIVEDGKGVPRISGEGSKFLEGLTFQRQVDFKDLPAGLQTEEVKGSISNRGFYAARQSVTVTEAEIQD